MQFIDIQWINTKHSLLYLQVFAPLDVKTCRYIWNIQPAHSSHYSPLWMIYLTSSILRINYHKKSKKKSRRFYSVILPEQRTSQQACSFNVRTVHSQAFAQDFRRVGCWTVKQEYQFLVKKCWDWCIARCSPYTFRVFSYVSFGFS